MKIGKQILSGVIGAAMFSVVYAATASAAAYCLDATVDGAGVRPANATATRSQFTVNLTCNDVPAKWTGSKLYYLTPDQGESGYATVLTALSLPKAVKVKLSSFVEYSLVENIDINP